MPGTELLGQAPEVGGVDSIVADVRARFVADFPFWCDRAAAMTADAETGNGDAAEALGAAAHRLAGLAGLVGFGRVGAVALELEDAVRRAAPPFAGDAVRVMIDRLRMIFAADLSAETLPPDAPASASARGLVLVAEDDGEQRRLLQNHLEQAGYTVDALASGSDVAARAASRRPAIILLDVEMPGLDGFGVCRQLKAEAGLSTIPIVFMTGRRGLDDRAAGLALGADDYLVKPVDPSELVLRLERIRAAERPTGDAATMLSFEEFSRMTADCWSQGGAALLLVRLVADQLPRAATALREEIRRADVLGQFDRSHLVVCLPGTSGDRAIARTGALISLLTDLGIDGVHAGVAAAEPSAPRSLATLVNEADAALLEARYRRAPVALHGQPGPAIPIASGTIVIAEDDPDVTRILDGQLQGAGYRTRLVFDGVEALASLAGEPADVLILDLMMPRLGGFTVLEELGRRGSPRPRTLVLSARGREADVTRAFELGADDFMKKPFNPQELLARVARLTRR